MAHALATWVLLSLLSGLIKGQFTHCPDGWMQFHDSCYLFAENTRLDWTGASHFCLIHHMSQLVVIETPEENAFIKDMCRRLVSAANRLFWTAATDVDIEGLWKWVTLINDDPLGYTDWGPGQPGSNHGHEEDCMFLYSDTGFNWHDGQCTSYGYPLCELRLGGQVIGKK